LKVCVLSSLLAPTVVTHIIEIHSRKWPQSDNASITDFWEARPNRIAKYTSRRDLGNVFWVSLPKILPPRRVRSHIERIRRKYLTFYGRD
jgi:hypothetical protein